MALKLACTTPSTSYSTHHRAFTAFTRACTSCGITDMAFLIVADSNDLGGRFFPVALPTADQIQDGINLAQRGITAVRT